MRISASDARRIALRSQGLVGRTGQPHDVAGVITRLGALQLDTISVLARSHELVCYSRLGSVGRSAVEAGVWGSDPEGAPRAVEYWGHAACILPLDVWPWLAFRRRRFRNSNRWQLAATPEDLATVRNRLRTEGPLTASELGGAKQGGEWWDWSPMKVAVEVLLDWGEVVCVTRRGWKRVYDLPDRVLPSTLVDLDPDDESCLIHLVRAAGARLGVGAAGELADYYRLTRKEFTIGLAGSGLVPVEVEGWNEPAWADPAALTGMSIRGRHRTTLISPFDSLVWHRPRTERLFGFTHRIEAYTPAPKRVYGYYPMPVLSGGQIVARVDPGRKGRTLVAKQVGLLVRDATKAVAQALSEAAQWVGADSIEIGEVDPPGERDALRRLVT